MSALAGRDYANAVDRLFSSHRAIEFEDAIAADLSAAQCTPIDGGELLNDAYHDSYFSAASDAEGRENNLRLSELLGRAIDAAGVASRRLLREELDHIARRSAA